MRSIAQFLDHRRPPASPATRSVVAVIEDGRAGPAVALAAITLARSCAATEVILTVPVEAGAVLTSDPAVVAAWRMIRQADGAPHLLEPYGAAA